MSIQANLCIVEPAICQTNYSAENLLFIVSVCGSDKYSGARARRRGRAIPAIGFFGASAVANLGPSGPGSQTTPGSCGKTAQARRRPARPSRPAFFRGGPRSRKIPRGGLFPRPAPGTPPVGIAAYVPARGMDVALIPAYDNEGVYSKGAFGQISFKSDGFAADSNHRRGAQGPVDVGAKDHRRLRRRGHTLAEPSIPRVRRVQRAAGAGGRAAPTKAARGAGLALFALGRVLGRSGVDIQRHRVLFGALDARGSGLICPRLRRCARCGYRARGCREAARRRARPAAAMRGSAGHRTEAHAPAANSINAGLDSRSMPNAINARLGVRRSAQSMCGARNVAARCSASSAYCKAVARKGGQHLV